MREALGSIPSVSMLPSMFFAATSNAVKVMQDLSGRGLGTRHVTRIQRGLASVPPPAQRAHAKRQSRIRFGTAAGKMKDAWQSLDGS